MKKLVIAIAAVLPLVAFTTAHAQKLEPGKWTGTVAPPGEQAMDVTYDVTMKGDTIGIAVNAGEHGTFTFNDVKLDADTLTFWFAPGPRVECTLKRAETGAFAGECRDPEGGIATMAMIPPKKE